MSVTPLKYEMSRYFGKNIAQKLLYALQGNKIPANYRNATGFSFLDFTTDFDLTKILLEAGANPNTYNSAQSPLYNALRKQKLKTAKLLIEKGALNSGELYNTPRDLLIQMGTNEAMELVKLLDQNEANYVSCDGSGRKRKGEEAGLEEN